MLNKKLRVVQLSSVHPLRDTRIFYKICTSLVNAGYDVDLIIQHTEDEKINGINIKSLPVASRKLDRPLKIIPRLLFKAVSYPRGTIFHFHDPELLPVGFILKLLGHKIIYDVHEDVPGDIADKEWISPFTRKIIIVCNKILEKLSIKYFEKIITVTVHIRNKLDDNVLIIQNYPLISEISYSGKNQQKKDEVIYVGNITEVRGVLDILESVNIMNRKYKIDLVLAGKFGDVEIEKKARSHSGWQHVKYKEWLSREEIANAAMKARAGFVIFHPTKNHLNAQPNKLFEYMLHKLPIIASDFPLWREIVLENNCGILVNPESPEEIVEAIDWIFDNPEEARLMGENGRKAVLEKYNWAKEEEKLLNLYANL